MATGNGGGRCTNKQHAISQMITLPVFRDYRIPESQITQVFYIPVLRISND